MPEERAAPAATRFPVARLVAGQRAEPEGLPAVAEAEESVEQEAPEEFLEAAEPAASLGAAVRVEAAFVRLPARTKPASTASVSVCARPTRRSA